MRKYSGAYIPTFADIPPGGERRTATFLVPCNYFGDVRKKRSFRRGDIRKKDRCATSLCADRLVYASVNDSIRYARHAQQKQLIRNDRHFASYSMRGPPVSSIIFLVLQYSFSQSCSPFSSSCNTPSLSLVRHFHRPATCLLPVSSLIFPVLQYAFS